MKCLNCNTPIQADQLTGARFVAGELQEITDLPGVIEGRYSVCFTCGAIGRFNASQDLVLLSGEELIDLFLSHPGPARILLDCRQSIKKNNQQNT